MKSDKAFERESDRFYKKNKERLAKLEQLEIDREKNTGFIADVKGFFGVGKRKVIAITVLALTALGIGATIASSAQGNVNAELNLQNKITSAMNTKLATEQNSQPIKNFNINGIDLIEGETTNQLNFYGIANLAEGNEFRYAKAGYNISDAAYETLKNSLNTKNAEKTINEFVNAVSEFTINNAYVNEHADIMQIQAISSELQNIENAQFIVGDKVLKLGENQYTREDIQYRSQSTINFIGEPVIDLEHNKITFEIRTNIYQQVNTPVTNFFTNQTNYEWQDYIMCTKTDTIELKVLLTEEVLNNKELMYQKITETLDEGMFTRVKLINSTVIETPLMETKLTKDQEFNR